MDADPSHLDRLIGGLYAASFGERGWHDVVSDIERTFGAPGASIIDVDLADGSIRSIVTNRLAPRQDDYVARMNAINPRMRRALAQPGPHVAVDYDGLPEEAIRRHEFYDWLDRECGVKYFVGARMLDQGSIISFASVEFTAAHGPADDGEVALFRRLVPHVANAWRLTGKMATLQAETHALAAVADRSDIGIIALDTGGRVVSASREAERILGAGDGLTAPQAQLRATQAAADRGLQIAIAGALDCVNARGGRARTLLAIPRPSRRRDYVMELLACAGRLGYQPASAPVVFVFVSDPETAGIDTGLLRSLYGLTMREAQLAALLHGGGDLSGAARDLGMARNTARVHLSAVLRKTGCASRAELVALLAGIAPFDGSA